MGRLNKNKKLFPQYGLAYDYIMDKIKEKDTKGYKRIPNHLYFSFTYNGEPLSDLIKLIESKSKES